MEAAALSSTIPTNPPGGLTAAARPVSSAGDANRSLIAVLLFGNVGLGVAAMAIALPSMLGWEAAFGASRAAVQATYGAYLTTFALAQLICGPLSDQIGRRPVLIAGLLVFVGAGVLSAFATSIEMLIAGRALQGIGACTGMVVGRALVQDLYDGPERTRMLALTGIAMGVGPPTGTVLGGYLDLLLGWQSTFLATVVMGLVLLLIAWRVELPSRRRGKLRLLGMFSSYARLLGSLDFMAYVMTVAGCTAAFYAFLGGSPAVLKSMGVAADRVGWYIFFCSGAYIFGSYITGRLARRVSDRRFLLVGQTSCLFGTGTVLLLGLNGNQQPLLFALPVMFMGFGHSLIQPAGLKGAVGIGGGDAGAASAVAGALQQAVGAAAGYSLGLLAVLTQASVGMIMIIATLISVVATARVVFRRG